MSPAGRRIALTLLAAGLTACASPGERLPGAVRHGERGPTVVLQAGLGDDHRVWAAVAEALAADHVVVALDRPGHGGIPLPAGPRDPCTLADEQRQQLLRLGLSPPWVLVGHSLGGAIQYAHAALHPDEVAGLVLVDATPPGHWARMQHEAPSAARLLSVLRATVFSEVDRREFDDQDGCQERLASRPPLRLPTRVLVAGRLRPEERGDFAAMLARSRPLWLERTGAPALEPVESAGHYIQRDAPGRVVQAVRAVTGLKPRD